MSLYSYYPVKAVSSIIVCLWFHTNDSSLVIPFQHLLGTIYISSFINKLPPTLSQQTHISGLASLRNTLQPYYSSSSKIWIFLSIQTGISNFMVTSASIISEIIRPDMCWKFAFFASRVRVFGLFTNKFWSVFIYFLNPCQ